MTAAEELTAALAGRYLVEREVGRGGMATVYLARDLRHERPVALKVLHPELGAILGPERFLAEIRVTANLQHPNLLPLFDSGEAEGRLFYTMPFLEGESLRQRLEREQQLPVGEAVRLAVAVASALDHAHRKGIVHRDLKPENILLADGQPLVADFGIALAVSRAGGQRVTQTGLSLGTPHYMSPEQAAGDRQLDARADVYALGCVLYEMLAGEPPFTGPSAQAVMAKLMTEPARPVARLRHTVPAHVDAAIARALEKLPADRFASAQEFAEALQRPEHAIGTGESTAAPGDEARDARPTGGWRARRRDPLVLALAATAASALLIAGVSAWSARSASAPAPRATPVRFTLAVPLGEQRLNVPGTPVVFSPDGRAIIYSARVGAAAHSLYYRPLHELHAQVLPRTEGARAPFLSPDGASLGFVTPDGRLVTMRLDGGAPVALATVTGGTEGAWTPDDVIVFGSGRGLLRVAAAGGTPELLTRVDSARGERYHGGPRALADGRTVLFTAVSNVLATDRIGIASLESGRSVVLDVVATNALAMVEGHLVVGRADGSIVAIPFDEQRWVVTGPPVTIADGVLVKPYFGTAASAANDGSLVYVRGSSLHRLALVDEQGVSRPVASEPQRYSHPRFSPDGRRIAVEVEQASPTPGSWADIWVHDLGSGVLSRLTSQRPFAARPEWTPDGRRVAFISQSMVGAGGEVWWVPSDGSGPEEPLRITPKLAIQEVTFSPDGRYAVVREGSDEPTSRDLWLVPLGDATAGDTTPLRATPIFRTPFFEFGPRISPDGRWLAYVVDETGRNEVYVRPFPGPGGRVQVSAGGGAEPIWADDGELLYRSGDRFLGVMLGPGAESTTPSIASRRQVFAGTYSSDEWRAQYDVRRGGREFVVLQRDQEDEELVVVLDWLGELRARAATPRTR